jgi:hypothetical protein
MARSPYIDIHGELCCGIIQFGLSFIVPACFRLHSPACSSPNRNADEESGGGLLLAILTLFEIVGRRHLRGLSVFVVTVFSRRVEKTSYFVA